LFAFAPLLRPKLALRAFLFYLLNEIAKSWQGHKLFIKCPFKKTQIKGKFGGKHIPGQKKERKNFNGIRKNYKEGLNSFGN